MILESNIDDNLWPELVLAMTYIKNNWPTRALQNISPHKAHFYKQPNLTHLRLLGSTVYVLLHKEKRLMKSEKWAPRALKETLVGYNGHTIYRVHIKEQNKFIWIKNFYIFEDYKTKESTKLPDYTRNLRTFQSFCYKHDNDKLERTIPRISQKVSAREEDLNTRAGRTIPRASQKVSARE